MHTNPPPLLTAGFLNKHGWYSAISTPASVIVHSCGDLWHSAPCLTITPTLLQTALNHRFTEPNPMMHQSELNLVIFSSRCPVCLCKWCWMWRALNIDHYVGVCVFCNCVILSLSPSDTVFCWTDSSLAWIRVCTDCDVDLDLERMPWSSPDYLLVFFMFIWKYFLGW